MAAKTDLVIVESPSKAKTIGKYLGPGYEVKASMGHVRDLPKSKIGVDIEGGFVPQYQPIKGKEDVISDLKKAAKKSGRVYLATDPDREGEAISWHLKELLDIPDDKTYRVTFNEITKKVVNDSIAAPRAIDQNLVDAQQARRILDRIVGYELSPLLWRKIRRGLSAGRVQSVATRLVAEREEEIRAFVPQEYWTIEAELEQLGRRIADAEEANAAVELASEALRRADETLRARFSPQITAEAGHILAELTENKYPRVLLEPDMHLSVREADGQVMRPAAAMSCGTADQMYLALRLAMCRRLLPPDAPMVLDDALVNFDPARTRAALRVLREEPRQFLLFTCRPLTQEEE